MSQEIFKQIKELLESWNISTEDWIVSGKHARRFAGYDVKLRKNHINILVNCEKIPWKHRILNFAETIPGKKTKYFMEFVDFMKRTNYDFDITPTETKLFQKFKKNRQKHEINGDSIYYLNILDNLKLVRIKLEHCNEKELGLHKGLRFLEAAKNLKELAKEKDEKEVIETCNKIIKDYSFIKPPKDNPNFTGIPLGEGKITGKVIVIKDDDVKEIYDPRILVTQEFSTKHMAYFDKILGVITETGGLVSHQAIMSREFDLPVILHVRNATKLLKDGQYVTMNLDTGQVIVKAPETQ